MSMLDLGALGFDLVLNKKGWNESFEEADDDVVEHESKWKSAASNIGGGIKLGIVGAIVGITTAVGAMAIAGGNSAIELQDHMQKFQSATGITAEETEKVKNTIQELYKVNEDSYEDIANMATALSNNMGMNAEEIQKYSQNYLDYAKITGQANEDAVGAIDDLGDAWGLTLDESVNAMDKLLFISQEYGMSVQDSQGALTKMAPAAKAMGISMDEASAYLAMFAQTGIDAGTASTAFTKALQAVKSPEELKTLISDIQACEDPMKRAQMATELFGAKAGPQMAQALGESDISIDAFIENMNKTQGAVANASAEYDKSLKVQLELMKKQFGGLFEELAEKLLPIINNLLNWVVTNMPTISATLSGMFDVVGNILTKIVEYVGIVVQAFIDWFNNNQDTVNKFKDMFDKFKMWFEEIFNSIVVIVKTVWEIISQVWDTYGSDVMKIAEKYFGYIGTIIDSAMTNIKNIIDLAFKIIKGDWSGAWEAIKKLVSDAWDGVGKIIDAGLQVVKSIFEGAWTLLMDVGKGALNAVWDGMKSIWTGISNWVGEKVQWLADKLMFWKSSKSEMSNGESINGSAFNGLDYVPFDGYIARLHEGERVLTKEENKYFMQGGNSGNGIVISIENFVNDRKQDVQAFAEELEFYRHQAALARGGGR